MKPVNQNDNPCDRIIRLRELMKIFGVCGRTIKRKSMSGELPPLVRSCGVVGMLESKVREYLQRLREQRGI